MIRKIDDYLIDHVAQPVINALGLCPTKTGVGVMIAASAMSLLHALTTTNLISIVLFMILSIMLLAETRTISRETKSGRGVRSAYRLVYADQRVLSVSLTAIAVLLHALPIDVSMLVTGMLVASTVARIVAACDEPPPPAVSLAGSGA